MLTDQQCRAAKAQAAPLKLFDGNGLFLHVTKAGHKGWRWKYRFGGKEQLLVFGPYPDITLRQARDLRDDARKELREGRDPAEEFRRKAKRRTLGVDPESTFRVIAERWHAQQSGIWKGRHADDVKVRMEADVYPSLGSMAIGDIKPSTIMEVLKAVEARGAIETAHRLRQRISAVFRFAIALELVDVDPAAALSDGLRPKKKGRQPALLKISQAREFLQAYEADPGHPTTKLASRLLALTAVRPGVIQFAQLTEFEDLDGNEPIWRIPAEKMKLGLEQSEQEAFEFIVPLARQAVEVVKAAAAHAKNRNYLFPSARHSHRPITNNALNTAYRRVQVHHRKHVPHGWRSSFSTIMNERAIELERPGDRQIIDLMLAHVSDGVEGRYNRAAYMPRRRLIAQEWADLLLQGVPPAATLLDVARR